MRSCVAAFATSLSRVKGRTPASASCTSSTPSVDSCLPSPSSSCSPPSCAPTSAATAAAEATASKSLRAPSRYPTSVAVQDHASPFCMPCHTRSLQVPAGTWHSACPSMQASDRTSAFSPSATFSLASSTFSLASSRSMGSLSGKTGIPGPRPEISEQMSTMQGGHIARLIRNAETVKILDDILFSNRRKLTGVHAAVACRRLEHLYKLERRTTSELKLKQIAFELEQIAASSAARLTVSQVSQVMRGLTNSNHQLSDASLLPLAAVLIQDGCQRMQLAGEMEIKDVIYGFGHQKFNNPAFWEHICKFVTPRIYKMSTENVASILHSMSQVSERNDHLLKECCDRLTISLQNLPSFLQITRHHKIISGTAASCAALSFCPPKLVDALFSAALASMGQFPAKDLAIFMHEAMRLEQPVPITLSKAAAKHAIECKELMKPFYLSKMVDAMATLGVDDHTFFVAMADQVRPELVECKPGVLELLTMAFGKAPAPVGADIVGCISSLALAKGSSPQPMIAVHA